VIQVCTGPLSTLPNIDNNIVGTRHLSKFWKEAGNIGGADDITLDDVLNGRTHSKQ
jgi:hypothetical protein